MRYLFVGLLNSYLLENIGKMFLARHRTLCVRTEIDRIRDGNFSFEISGRRWGKGFETRLIEAFTVIILEILVV